MSIYSYGSNTNYTTEIILNVYDLSQPNFTTSCLKSFGIGFYHTGIEINGIEYSYGGNFTHQGTGVFTQTPLQVDGATYKESFLMGTVRDQQKLNQIMEEVKFEFKANQYDLIKKNCNHFSEAFTLSLLGKRIPSFINRASRIGFYASCFLPKMIKNSNPIPQDQDHTQNVQTRGNDAYNNQPQNLPFQMDSTNSDYTMDSSRVAFTGKGYRIADYETDNI